MGRFILQLIFLIGKRKKLNRTLSNVSMVTFLSMFMNRLGVKGVLDVIPGYPKAVFLIKNCNEKERSNSTKS